MAVCVLLLASLSLTMFNSTGLCGGGCQVAECSLSCSPTGLSATVGGGAQPWWPHGLLELVSCELSLCANSGCVCWASYQFCSYTAMAYSCLGSGRTSCTQAWLQRGPAVRLEWGWRAPCFEFHNQPMHCSAPEPRLIGQHTSAQWCWNVKSSGRDRDREVPDCETRRFLRQRQRKGLTVDTPVSEYCVFY